MGKTVVLRIEGGSDDTTNDSEDVELESLMCFADGEKDAVDVVVVVVVVVVVRLDGAVSKRLSLCFL